MSWTTSRPNPRPSWCKPTAGNWWSGSKEVLLGENRYRYDPSHYLLATIELPSVRRVLEASKEQPYLSLRLELAPTLVGEVMVEAGHASSRDPAEVRAIAVSPLDVHLLDACVRLVRILELISWRDDLRATG
jgi:hypothetical protein